MSDPVSVRTASADDVASIADIYNHYILNSTATFDMEVTTTEARAQWLAGRGPEHPVTVAVGEAGVAGWGALSPWAGRPAWLHTVEVSIYVAPEATGRGIGPLLLTDLERRAREIGHHVLLSQIVSENEPSLKMSERAGYRRAGMLTQVGRKFDRWLDVVIVEKVL